MLADYFNNPLMPMSYSGVSEKWYEVARSREKRLFQRVDVFMYLSMSHDNAFDLLYVAIDEVNQHLVKCYHGKFIVKIGNNYLIIRQGLWRKKFLIIANDDEKNIVALTNRRKSKVWVLSKKLPYDKNAFENVLKQSKIRVLILIVLNYFMMKNSIIKTAC